MSKTENRAGDICKIYRIWTRLASVYSMDSKLKNSFLVSWIFPEKPIVSYCWVSKVLQTYKIWSKLLIPCWEKIWIFIFLFLCELPLILVVGGKLKIKDLGYLRRTPDIEFQWYRSIGLGAMFSDCQRDRRTDKCTFFLKHFFKVRDWYCIEWKSINNQSLNFLRLQYFVCSWRRLKVKIKMPKSNFWTFASILKILPGR